MNSTQEKVACWIAGLKEAIADKNRDKTKKYQQKDDFTECLVSNLKPGNVIKLNNRLHLIEAVRSNKGVHTLIVVHRSRRDARSFFASETVLKKVS